MFSVCCPHFPESAQGQILKDLRQPVPPPPHVGIFLWIDIWGVHPNQKECMFLLDPQGTSAQDKISLMK